MVLETLISINGTKEAPVRDVTVQGITFRDAADITMNPWGVPSGGDWGLYRGGAIFVEGAEDITIQHNTLTRLDGNGAGTRLGHAAVIRSIHLRRMEPSPHSPFSSVPAVC